MAFTVHSREQEEHFSDDARYRFSDHGHLIVTGDGKQRTYSLSGWDYIEEPEPTGPGFYSF
jgi:CRISPR/Cas system CMR-associated protein Cmr3 (group 5 of RAMP superfamily)